MFKDKELESRVSKLEHEIEELKPSESPSWIGPLIMSILSGWGSSTSSFDVRMLSDKIQDLDKRLCLVEHKTKCSCKD